ncbi:hypothetical protein GCM10020255_081500 [Rhodococcus baikonurensis]
MTIDSSPGTTESTSRIRALAQKAADIVRFGIRDAPLTVVLLLTMWILGAATGSLVHGPSRDLEHTIGAGMGSIQHGRIWTPLTSALWAGNLLGYIGASVLLIAVAAPSSGGWERSSSQLPERAPRFSVFSSDSAGLRS